MRPAVGNAAIGGSASEAKRLARSQQTGRANRQLQDFAQRTKVRIPRACPPCFPEIHAWSGHTDLGGNVCYGQATTNASIAKVAAQADLSRQGKLQRVVKDAADMVAQRSNVILYLVFGKRSRQVRRSGQHPATGAVKESTR